MDVNMLLLESLILTLFFITILKHSRITHKTEKKLFLETPKMPKLAPKPVKVTKRQEIILETRQSKAASLPPETKPKPVLKKPTTGPPVSYKPKAVVRIQPPSSHTDSDRSELSCLIKSPLQ